jgi:dynein light chain LC8-type
MAEGKLDNTTDAGTGGIANAPSTPSPKAIIKNVDMSEELQQESVDLTHAALEKFNIEKDIAAHIKKEFDKRHGPTWHVVVGKNFGSYVTHGTSMLFYCFLVPFQRVPRAASGRAPRP